MKQMTAFVLMGLFVLILSGVAAAAEAAGGSSPSMVTGIIALGAGLGIAIAAFGCALAQGRVGGAAMESIGRNPNSADKIFTPLILSLGPHRSAGHLRPDHRFHSREQGLGSRRIRGAINRHDAGSPPGGPRTVIRSQTQPLSLWERVAGGRVRAPQ